MFLLAELKIENGQTVAVLTCPPKDFKTGSKGFYGMSKAEIDGKKYQIQVQIIEIGSKTKTEK